MTNKSDNIASPGDTNQQKEKVPWVYKLQQKQNRGAGREGQRLELSSGSISDEREVRRAAQHAAGQAVHEAEGTEHEQHVVSPHHEPEPDAYPAWAEYPPEEQGEYQEDVQCHRLHHVQSDVVTQARLRTTPRYRSKKATKLAYGTGKGRREWRWERKRRGREGGGERGSRNSRKNSRHTP